MCDAEDHRWLCKPVTSTWPIADKKNWTVPIISNVTMGWSRQCFNLNQPISTLLVIIKWICLAVFCQFYKFLARFSGRRRVPSYRHNMGTARDRRTRVFALFLVLTLIGSTQACSSRSTPKPRSPSPTARPNVTFHTYACPPAYAAWYCLNGATCFTVKIGEFLLYNCECADGYMGRRCEFKDLDGSYLPIRQKVMLEKASIASGAGIASILVVVVLMTLYIHRQRKRKEAKLTVPVTADLRERPFSRHPQTVTMMAVVTHSAMKSDKVNECASKCTSQP